MIMMTGRRISIRLRSYCGYTGATFLGAGDKVVIQDFNAAIITDVHCVARACVMTHTSPADQVEAFTLVKDDKDVSFDPTTCKQAITHLMNHATSTGRLSHYRTC
jgi:hypothetical protein